MYCPNDGIARLVVTKTMARPIYSIMVIIAFETKSASSGFLGCDSSDIFWEFKGTAYLFESLTWVDLFAQIVKTY